MDQRAQRVELPPAIGAEVTRQLVAARERVAAWLAKRRAAGETFEEPKPEDANEKRWLALCPPDFLDTDTEKLPCSRETWQRVLAHKIIAESIRLTGPTGSGKTRLAWLLLRPEVLNGMKVVALDSGQFSSAASAAYRDGREERFFRELMRPRILFLDDVGKGKMTARVVEALFTIIDRRGNARLPILATMNYTATSLTAKLTREESCDPETVAALERRLRERMIALPVIKAKT